MGSSAPPCMHKNKISNLLLFYFEAHGLLSTPLHAWAPQHPPAAWFIIARFRFRVSASFKFMAKSGVRVKVSSGQGQGQGQNYRVKVRVRVRVKVRVRVRNIGLIWIAVWEKSFRCSVRVTQSKG